MQSSHLQQFQSLLDDGDEDETISPNQPNFLDDEQVEGTGQSTPLDDSLHGLLPRDLQTRTAFYGYATEKSLSHAESKLFYQRHQLDQQPDVENPLPSRRTFPLSSDSDKEAGGLSRAASVNSRRSYDQSNAGLRLARSVFPGGLASLDEPANATDVHSPVVDRCDPQANNFQNHYVTADKSARGQSIHPDLSYEPQPSPLADQGIHGAGAGVGVGMGAGGYAEKDANVTSELSAIYTNIQKVLDSRHKYIRLSLQEQDDNPKDDPSWNIYPPPPEPVWEDEKDRPTGSQSENASISSSRVCSSTQDMRRDRQQQRSDYIATDAGQQPPYSPTRKRRKVGQNIGEDFEMSDLLPLPDEAEMTYKLDGHGIYQVYETSNSLDMEIPILTIPTIREFYIDLDAILTISSDGPSKSFAFRRLQYLEGKFNLYILLNEYQEMADSKRVPHRDFYNVRKVDTHVHHSACMNQKHLLRFIKSKMKKSPDEVVLYRDNVHLTLREVFESINLTAYDLSIDTLDMHVCFLIDYSTI